MNVFQKWNIGKINYVVMVILDIDKVVFMFRDVFGVKVSEKYVSYFIGNE